MGDGIDQIEVMGGPTRGIHTFVRQDDGSMAVAGEMTPRFGIPVVVALWRR